MPLISVPIGPIRAFYVGIYGDSSVLTRIFDIRTGGNELAETLPSDPLPVLNYGSIQADLHKVETTITFNSVSDTIIRMARGLALSADINDPMGQSEYAILMLCGNFSKKESYYLPRVITDKNNTINRSKTTATASAIRYYINDRDVTVDLHYQGTAAELKVIMGSRSPY